MNIITVSVSGRGSRHFPFATAAGNYPISIGYSRDEGVFHVTVPINELSHAIHAQLTRCSCRPDGANHLNALHPSKGRPNKPSTNRSQPQCTHEPPPSSTRLSHFTLPLSAKPRIGCLERKCHSARLTEWDILSRWVAMWTVPEKKR